MNKIILLKNVHQILKSFGITLLLKLSHNKIDNISYTNDHGVETVVSNDLDKANVLINYLSSVFNIDLCEVVPPCNVKCSTVMYKNIMDDEDVKKRLNNLNVYKSYGPDILHQKIMKELQNEISLPLKLIFECSLRTNKLPEDWKLGNITPIVKKGKQVVYIGQLVLRVFMYTI